MFLNKTKIFFPVNAIYKQCGNKCLLIVSVNGLGSMIFVMQVYEMTNVKNNWHRADTLKSWLEDGGIMIIGYEMYRNLSQGHHVKNKKQRKIFEECLVNPGKLFISV